MHNRREWGKKALLKEEESEGKERKGKVHEGTCTSYTTAYQFFRVEEIRGPVISFPDSALEEGKRSGILSSFAEKGGEKEGERNQIKLATSVVLILDHKIIALGLIDKLK